jgi:hypothetical protein
MELSFRSIRWAGAIVLTAAAAGCIATAPDPSLTINRANWVQTSIAADMSIAPLGEVGLIDIVADDGADTLRGSPSPDSAARSASG